MFFIPWFRVQLLDLACFAFWGLVGVISMCSILKDVCPCKNNHVMSFGWNDFDGV